MSYFRHVRFGKTLVAADGTKYILEDHQRENPYTFQTVAIYRSKNFPVEDKMPASVDPGQQIKALFSNTEQRQELEKIFKKAAQGYREVLEKSAVRYGFSPKRRGFSQSQRIGEWVTQLRRAFTNSRLFTSPNDFYPRLEHKHLFKNIVNTYFWTDAMEVKTSLFYTENTLAHGIKNILKKVVEEMKKESLDTDDSMIAISAAVQELDSIVGDLNLIAKQAEALVKEAEKKMDT